MTYVDKLALFANCPQLLLSMGRGIEREGLRIDEQGALAQTPHPAPLGSALKNSWITTDFAEQLLEFITPVSSQSAQTLAQLSDIHKFTYQAMPNEKIWPLSMPCCVPDEEEIWLGQYGTSNLGKMKTLYRQGLKNRYGSMMQIIAGVHFNFSFSKEFWLQLHGGNLTQENYQQAVSSGYFAVIRNYYRFGWLIPYLFGASPALCGSFLKRASALPFEKMSDGTLYLPYATSLRLSDLGYTSHAQSGLDLSFNSVDQYVMGVRRALKTPSPYFESIPVKNEQGYQQLNTNILQIENELYAPIRPKRVTLPGQRPLQALESQGVEYIEVRSLDVNPFSPVGIDLLQMDFLDLFLTWCALSPSAPMNAGELACWRNNWRLVVLEGRKPGLELKIGCNGEVLTQQQWGEHIFAQLLEISKVMDSALEKPRYQKCCLELSSWFAHPEKTFSHRMLTTIQQSGGLLQTGKKLAQAHQQFLAQQNYSAILEQQFNDESQLSLKKQKALESQDVISFAQYLDDYFRDIVPHTR